MSVIKDNFIHIDVDMDLVMECSNFLEGHSIAQRGVADGSKEEQLTGLIGEAMVKQAFNFKPLFSEGYDGGYDLELGGVKIDVKTMGRNVYPKLYYVNNFIALQEHFDCDVYVFCSLNRVANVLTICGWVTKEQLFDRGNKYKKGESRRRSDGSSFILKADTYEIENKYLNDFFELSTFCYKLGI